MPPQRRPRTVPCEQCKRKHLKCDGEDPCACCRKSGLDCIPGNRSLRLRPFAGPKSKESEPQRRRPSPVDTREPFHTSRDAGFAPGPTLSTDPGYCSPPESSGRQRTTSDSSLRRISSAGENSIRASTGDPDLYRQLPYGERRCGHLSTAVLPEPQDGPLYPEGGPPAFLDESPGILSYSGASDGVEPVIAAPPPAPLPLWYYEDTPRPPKTPGPLNLQEACLVRCFANTLADTFDTTDRTGHFATYLPMRALKNSLVLNAVCGVSSQYLLRMHHRLSTSGVIEYEGTKLPGLTEESAIQYHNACISLLIEASDDSEEYAGGDILSAITLLRFHEQTDVFVTGSDSEVFQRAVQHIFETQFARGRSLEEALPSLFTPLSIHQPNNLSANIAAYLVALRMEIWAVLLYQRPMRLPIPSFRDCLPFDDHDRGDDYMWTRRILIWCAHVLKLHFGSEGINASDDGYASRTELWGALKAFEYDWDTKRPSCFEPLYSRDRAPSEGRYFPEMWLANPCQVMALQHIEFGRIVLAKHEVRLQNMRLGGSRFASEAAQALFLHSTRIICGLTACHRHRHEALTSAVVAISLCGKHVHDAGEREAMMDIIDMLRSKYIWNVSEAVDALRIAEETSEMILR